MGLHKTVARTADPESREPMAALGGSRGAQWACRLHSASLWLFAYVKPVFWAMGSLGYQRDWSKAK